ncbi:MAG: 30S ribosomal protein S19 [Candidatus Woesearchaeota archaeon]
MAKKIFKFRGMTVEELQKLSLQDLLPFLTSDVRRKVKRGFTEQEQKLLKKLETKSTVKTHCRDMVILPSMIQKTIQVSKGNSFEDLVIQPEMVGHRLGEFVFTRKRVTHGGAGVGASKSTANQGRK